MRRKKSDLALFVNHKSDPDPEDKMVGLKPREISFALHLASTENIVQAYLDAGYDAESYSTLERLALELASNSRVQKVFQDQKEKNKERYRNDSMRVVEELKTIAFSSVDDYEIDEEGVHIKAGVDPRAMKAIRSIKKTIVNNHKTGDVETKIQLEMYDKLKAIDLSMRYHGLLTTDMPPLEVVFARLPAELADKLRSAIASGEEVEAIGDGPVVDEALVKEQAPVQEDENP